MSFQFGTFTKKTAVNLHVQVCVKIKFHFSGMYAKSVTSGPFLAIKRIAKPSFFLFLLSGMGAAFTFAAALSRSDPGPLPPCQRLQLV